MMEEESLSEKTVGEELRKVGLFKNLGEAQIAKLCRIARVARYKRGEHLFLHGDPSDRIFIVLEGKVRISRTIEGLGEEALAILDAGTYFGELSIVDDGPRSADAVAHES